MTLPLLKSKLYIPPVRTELVSRPRLIGRLNAGLSRKLTLASAPAGFGKTTLITEWLAHFKGQATTFGSGTTPKKSAQNRSVAWLSLDEGDNDPHRFWSYLIAALQTVHPGVGESALNLLQSPQPLPLEAIVTLLINDVMSVSSQAKATAKTVLVLDDYHMVESPPIHAGITFLLDHLPPQLHLVITSRSDPALPLARLRARNQLTEFRADDLRFTSSEATAFLQIMDVELSADHVAALEARTEGWIAGLQLAAVSMQNRTDIDKFVTNFTGDHHFVLDYLAEEVFYRQPQNVQDFLLKTGILNRLTGPLCDAVSGRNDSQIMLEQLARANLFVIPLDDQYCWFRYHRLFADLLRHHLRRTSANIEEMHRRAAYWYEKEGYIDQAIKHALVAKDFEQVEKFITANIVTLLEQDKLVNLSNWLSALPEAWLSAHPKLGVAQAWLLFLHGKLNESLQRLQDVERALKELDSNYEDKVGLESTFGMQHVPPLVKGLYGQIAIYQGDIAHAINLMEQSLVNIPQEDLMLRAYIAQNLSLAYWLNGNVEAADRVMPAISIPNQLGDSIATLISTGNMAEQYWFRGSFTQAKPLLERVIHLSKQHRTQLPFISGVAYVELGHILYEQNDLVGAKEYLLKGVQQGEGRGSVRVLVIGFLGLILVYKAQGNLDAAFDILQQVEMHTRELKLSSLVAIVDNIKMSLWVETSNLNAIAQWMQNNADYRHEGPDIFHDFRLLTLAQAQIALGRLDEARQSLVCFLEEEQIMSASGVRGRVKTLLALVYQSLGETANAIETIEQALSDGEPEGYIRTFVDGGPPMAALLLKLVESRHTRGPHKLPTPGYIYTLLEALGVGGMVSAQSGPSVSAQSLVDPLTARELEVLTLILQGLNNQQIVDQLIIAKSTLKSHIKHIYSKLDACNRIEAVAKAKELGLLK